MARAKQFRCKGCGKLIYLRRVCNECAEKWPAVKFLRDWTPGIYTLLNWFDGLKKTKQKPESHSGYVGCDQWLASDRLCGLNPDELEEIRRAFGPLQQKSYLSNHVDKILGASAAATLCNLASGIAREVSEWESDPELIHDLEITDDPEAVKFRNEIEENKNRAIWLAYKATELYAHPLLFDRLDNLLESMGKKDDAKKMREIHNKEKLAWTPKYTDKMLMMSLNPENPVG
jgi:hypothetical protein